MAVNKMTSIPTNFRLITIPVSHYVEKVRWAMDYLQIPFQELPHMPPFHQGATKKYGTTLVPVLVSDMQVTTDSTDIMRYLDSLDPGKLYPAEPESQVLITELETLFNLTLGVQTRRWGYSHILTRELLYSRWTFGVPIWEKLLFPILFPTMRSIIRDRFEITETSAAESCQEIVGVFDRVTQLLADGRKYLLGDRFSAVDITFAALAAPILQPAEQHISPPPLDSLPPQMQADIHTCRSTPAGEFGLRLYREDRE
jgi:glutathione S-transferase